MEEEQKTLSYLFIGKPAETCWRRMKALITKFPEPRRIVQIAKAQALHSAQKIVPLPAYILVNKFFNIVFVCFELFLTRVTDRTTSQALRCEHADSKCSKNTHRKQFSSSRHSQGTIATLVLFASFNFLIPFTIDHLAGAGERLQFADRHPHPLKFHWRGDHWEFWSTRNRWLRLSHSHRRHFAWLSILHHVRPISLLLPFSPFLIGFL